ncbi:MAG: transglycosylase SLT domain-containing protein [Oligoflexus sp.]
MRILSPIMLLLGLPLAWTTRLDAPLPPEATDLVVLKGDQQPMDSKLANWFAAAESSFDIMKLSQEDFNKRLSDLGPAAQLYLRMKKLEEQNRRGWQSSGIKLSQEVEKFIGQQAWAADPLLGDLLFELLRLDDLPDERRKLFASKLSTIPVRSCAQKRLILDDLQNNDKKNLTSEVAKDYITRIGGFKAKRFQENALQELLSRLDEKSYVDLQPHLIDLVRPFPRLIADHSWLVAEEEEAGKKLRSQEPFLSFDRAEEAAENRHCVTARNHFLKALKHDPDKLHFPAAQATLSKIESCYRRKGSRARLRFWTEIKAPLSKAYGFSGEELALRPQGLIYWGQDEFEKARKIFTYLLETAQKEGHKEIESRTLYTFSRIEENEGRLPEAIAKYQQFIQKFPEDEQINEALSSLVVLNSITSQEKQALDFARKIIEREVLKDIKDRDTGTMSFGLFWAGKLSLSLGENLQAYEYWRRLTSEFYSTFYGALGHHMMETLLQKRFIIPPNYVASFDFESMKKSFGAEDLAIIKRIDLLLQLGLREDALCETRELDVNPDHEMQNLVLSMYLYASGDWLSAIRHYGNLSRTFRHTLPQGMERLLFPRDHMPLIESYAQRVKVEEPIIYAIMRQESVFNPRARSPVGASGLMQLMPATARMEARMLSRGYVSGAYRKSLVERSKNSYNLFDPETNIALGVHHVHRLLGRYSHPVFMLTSYNANPRATARWQENIDSTNMLAFIERIPYRETQSYVKLVMRNYFYYNRWYNPANTPMPLMDYLAPQVISVAKKQPLKDEPFITQ